jgi:hypothetical protein
MAEAIRQPVDQCKCDERDANEHCLLQFLLSIQYNEKNGTHKKPGGGMNKDRTTYHNNLPLSLTRHGQYLYK